MSEINTPAHQLPAGTVLSNKYEIIRTLGEGGFGITYMGRDTVLDIPVAIKEYYPHGYANRSATHDLTVTITDTTKNLYFSKWKEKFLSEARTLAKFSNIPNIVNVLDFFEQNGTAYIVMEYLNGQTLSDYVSTNGVFNADRLCRIMIPMLRSLNKIHQKKLIHRDISPDNIMVMPDGSLKLYDFGAARGYSETTQKSLSVMLKPGFAPEEQYRSRGLQGPWTDVYAVCATMYFCITGIKPDDSLQRAFSDELKPPSELGICISPRIEEALLMGMSVKSEDRFRNAEALATAFERGLSISEQTSPSRSSVKPMRRPPRADKKANSRDNYTEIVRTELEKSAENKKRKITLSGVASKIHAKMNKKIIIEILSGLAACGIMLTIVISSVNAPESPAVSDETKSGSLDVSSLMSDIESRNNSLFSSISINPFESTPVSIPDINSYVDISSIIENHTPPTIVDPDFSTSIDISSLMPDSSSSGQFEISAPNLSTSIDISSLIPEDPSSVQTGSLYPYLGSLNDTLPSTNVTGSSSSSFTETADRLQYKNDVIYKGSVSEDAYDAIRYSFQTQAGLSAFYSDYALLNDMRSNNTEDVSDIEGVRRLYSGLGSTIDKCLSDLNVVKRYSCRNTLCSSYYESVISLAGIWEEYLQTLKQYSTVSEYITLNSINNKRKEIEPRIAEFEKRFQVQFETLSDVILQDTNNYWKMYGKNWGEYLTLFLEFIEYFDSINEITPETMGNDLTIIQSYSSRLLTIENKLSGYTAEYDDNSGFYSTMNDFVQKAETYVEACEELFSSSSFDNEFILLAERVDACRNEVSEAYDKAVAMIGAAASAP